MINIWEQLNSHGKGVEVYFESIFSGKLRKIITSKWPSGEEMGNLIPNPEYGTLNRIEYNTNWIKVYRYDVKKKDTKDYMKKLAEFGFTENEEKKEDKTILEYKISNKNNDNVIVKYSKNNKTLEINAEKAE